MKEKESAALKLQSHARVGTTKRELVKKHQSASLLQAKTRQRKATAGLAAAKGAAVVLQSAVRGKEVREEAVAHSVEAALRSTKRADSKILITCLFDDKGGRRVIDIVADPDATFGTLVMSANATNPSITTARRVNGTLLDPEANVQEKCRANRVVVLMTDEQRAALDGLLEARKAEQSARQEKEEVRRQRLIKAAEDRAKLRTAAADEADGDEVIAATLGSKSMSMVVNVDADEVARAPSPVAATSPRPVEDGIVRELRGAKATAPFVDMNGRKCTPSSRGSSFSSITPGGGGV